MARKKKRKVNSKLITILIFLAIPILFILIVAVDSKKPILPRFIHELLGRDPVVLLEQAEKQLTELKDHYKNIKAENRLIADPKEAAEKWEQVFEDDYAPHAMKVYDLIVDGKRFSKGDTELQIHAQELTAQFHLITGTYIGGALGAWDAIIKLNINNYEAWENKADFYAEVVQNYQDSSSIEKLRESVNNLIEIKPEEPKGHCLALMADIYNLRYDFSSNVLADESAVVAKLTELKEKYPDNVRLAKCAALLYDFQARETDSFERKRSLMDKAGQELKAAMEANPENVEAAVNYCKYYLDGLKNVIHSELVKAGNEIVRERLTKELVEFNDSAKGEFAACLLKYPDNAELKTIYADCLLTMPGTDYDEPVKLYKQAVELDPDNLINVTVLGKLVYITGVVNNSGNDFYEEARVYLRKAYYGFNDSYKRGVLGSRIISSRYAVTMPYLALVDSRLADSVDDAKSELQDMLTVYREDKGKDVAITRSIEGLIDIADNNPDQAMQKLYTAVSDSEISSISPIYAAELRWMLFELLKDTQYKLIAINNAAIAYKALPRPASDFAELLDTYLAVPDRTHKFVLVGIIENYRNTYSDNQERLNSTNLQYVQALLAVGEVDKAREVLGTVEDKGLTYDVLKCQVISDEQERLQAIEELAGKYPDEPDVVSYVNSIYFSKIKDDKTYLDKAKALIARAVAANPDNFNFLMYQKRLEEPDPQNVTFARQLEIQKEAIESLKDPYQQAMMFGRYYKTVAAVDNVSNEQDLTQDTNQKAVESFEKASEIKQDSVEPLNAMLATYMSLGEFDKAEEIIDRINAIDSSFAEFASIDLIVARGNNEEAIEKLQDYLDKNPLSAKGHLVLAKVYLNLKRTAEAKAELAVSLSQDRFDPEAIAEYLRVLHEDNLAIGMDKIGESKVEETLSWAERLLSLDSNNIIGARYFVIYAPLWLSYQDQQLQAPNLDAEARQRYLDKIAGIESMAMRNVNLLLSSIHNNESLYLTLLRSLQNMQDITALAQRQEAYQDIMRQIFDVALKELPDSLAIMSNYEMFLRATGQSGKGMEMLKEQVATADESERVDAVLALARLYYIDKEMEKAVSLLTEQIAKCENLDLKLNLRIMLADVYKGIGDFDNAIKVYEQQRMEKDSDRIMTMQIETMMDSGYADKAEPLLDEMEKNYPDDYKVYLLRAKNAIRQADYETAVQYADKALVISPDNTIGLGLKSQALFLDNKYTEAKDVVDKLRRVSSDNPNQGRALLAQIYWGNNQYDEAILELRKGIEIEPGNAQLNQLLLDMLRSRREWNDLVGYYQGRIKMYPQNIALYSDCAKSIDEWASELIAGGNSGLANEKLKIALSLLNTAIQVSQETKQPTAGLIDSKAAVFLRMGMNEEAVSLLEANLELVDAMPVTALKYVEALYKLDRKQKAFDIFEAILSKIGDAVTAEYVVEKIVRVISSDEMISWVDSKFENSNNKGLMYLIKALAYRVNGDTEQFVAQIKLALEQAGDGTPVQILAKSKLAMSFIQSEQYDKAIVLYRELTEKVPGSMYMLNNLAYALLSKGGNEKEALEVATRAYEMARLEPMVLDTYGMALRQNKKYNQAYQVFKKAIQEAGRRNQVVPLEFEFHLAQVMKDLELVDDASESLEDLLHRAEQSKLSADRMLIDDIKALLDELK